MTFIDARNLDAAAFLDSEIQPLADEVNFNAPPSAIFLTGATGFVAAYILAELIDRTNADIYALVRGADTVQGRARIQQNLESYHLWQPVMESRVVPVVGDLKLPLLGLTKTEFDRIAEVVDVIFHVGSKLSYVAPYEYLCAANVGGTQETLRLATRIKPKPYHFVSSLGILLDYNAPLGGQEDDELCADMCPEVGYFQTKYVSERVVRIARERGIPITIHRIGLIVGDSQQGYSNEDDFVARILIGCIQAGYGPDVQNAMDMTPVDYVARAIVYLAFQPESQGNVFHLLNPQPISWSDIMDTVVAAGYPICKLPFYDWVDAIERYEDPQTNPLHPLLPFFHIPIAGRMLGVSQTAYHALGTQATQAALRSSGIVCPPVDQALVNIFLKRFVDSGRLAPADMLARI